MKKSPGLMLFALLILCLASCGSSTTSASSVSMPTVTRAPRPTTTSAPASGSPAVLGATLDAFKAKYGQPNSHSNAQHGSYHFQSHGNSKLDFLILQTDMFDGGGYTQSVMSITAQSPDAGWPPATASTICSGFFPSDAVYKNQQFPTTYGYDKIYYSASLASLFPASSFNDANQNQVQAGMFDVQYLTKSPSDQNIVDCDIQIGTEQTQ